MNVNIMARGILIFIMLYLFNDLSAQDNPELKKMYDEDQNARSVEIIDWKLLSKQDSIRRNQVSIMIKQNILSTANDYYHAAMIYQHGRDSSSYKLAWHYSKKAFMLDTTHQNARWLIAASYDRYLLSINKPQVYGTQFMTMNNKYYLRDIDTTLVSDVERKYYGTRTLNEIREYLTQKNGENQGLLIFPKPNKVITR